MGAYSNVSRLLQEETQTPGHTGGEGLRGATDRVEGCSCKASTPGGHSHHLEEQEETREDSVQNLEGAWRCGSLDFRLPGPSVRGNIVEGSHAAVCEGSPSQ